MRSLLLIVSLIVLTGCSPKTPTKYLPCPKVIDKVPKVYVKVNSKGGYDKSERIKVDKLVYWLRIVENYYHGTLL